VSYYDYYQPEAYLPVTDVYIEKDLSINDEIEKLRLSTSSALLSGRRDVLVVSSVSCLYGIGNPDDFHANTITLRKGQKLDQNRLLYLLVDAMYSRNENDFKRGTFRVRAMWWTYTWLMTILPAVSPSGETGLNRWNVWILLLAVLLLPKEE
jgi:excinuclease ABC subunit B